MIEYTCINTRKSIREKLLIVRKQKRDKHGAPFQSSLKTNRMLITRLICIQWKFNTRPVYSLTIEVSTEVFSCSKVTSAFKQKIRYGKARHLSHQLFLSLLHKVKHGAVTLRGSYSYFPRSPLGTLGTMSPFWHAHEKKKKKEEKRNACLFRVSQLKQTRLNIFRRYNETRFNDSEILQQFL